ncbi:hypothetical protein EJ04DRAFT_561225 [Polyplosphaeria fusca]|uniref:Uncharacterized protein n=1 Tax=Polyplosphaeria fusca TaxID=682080 RepID=A0A9P4R314_9PLEO|nr:hypothetical protein EJ04DRAFT_561225 [Polyplosphaeria fusca]
MTSITCHETLLPVLDAALKLGTGEDDKTSPLRLVLDPHKIFVLSDDNTKDSVNNHPTMHSHVRLDFSYPERPRKILGGNNLAYLFQFSGTSSLPKTMMTTYKAGLHSGLQGLITSKMIKVKGLQVAATEVEDCLLGHLEGFVGGAFRDACVAGVNKGREDGRLFVRAWVVLTEGGKGLGVEVVARKLDEWVRQRLSRHKWLTGGIETGCYSKDAEWEDVEEGDA